MFGGEPGLVVWCGEFGGEVAVRGFGFVFLRKMFCKLFNVNFSVSLKINLVQSGAKNLVFSMVLSCPSLSFQNWNFANFLPFFSLDFSDRVQPLATEQVRLAFITQQSWVSGGIYGTSFEERKN